MNSTSPACLRVRACGWYTTRGGFLDGALIAGQGVRYASLGFDKAAAGQAAAAVAP